MIKLEGFEILEHLGTGGMASVWKARQISLDREVAIKVLSSRLASTPEDVERFQSEARNAGRLKHSGIVQVYDAIFQNGVYCFVMEYVAGYTVGQWVRRKGCLTEAECLTLADCVANALDYAWKQCMMVHCDIKPDNVMVDADGTVKLTDLGLSRTVNALRSASDDEEVMGTPAYIAPEQAMGEPKLDCRTDMYSLGSMLYHLATGIMPFQGEAEQKVMELQVTSHIPNPRTIVPALSVPFCDLIEKLMAKDRAHRHADWEQVRADIVAVRLRRPLLPSGTPKPDASTVLADPSRPSTSSLASSSLYGEPPAVKTYTGLVFLGVMAATAVVAMLGWKISKIRASRPPATPNNIRTHTASIAVSMLAQAEDWEERNPNRNAEIIMRYQAVIDTAPESSEATLAKAAVNRIKARIAEKCDEVMGTLRARSDAKINIGDYAGAVADYAEYAGAYAEETRHQRMARAEELRTIQFEAERKAKIEADRRAEKERRNRLERERREQEQQAIERLLQVLVTRGIGAAKNGVDQIALNNPELVAQESLAEIRTIINGAHEAEKSVLQHYASRIGQQVEIPRARGATVRGKIAHVDWSRGDIRLTQIIGTTLVEHRINVRELPLSERVMRMGSENTPGLRLAKAMLAIENNAYEFARDQISDLPEVLKNCLLGLMPEK